MNPKINGPMFPMGIMRHSSGKMGSGFTLTNSITTNWKKARLLLVILSSISRANPMKRNCRRNRIRIAAERRPEMICTSSRRCNEYPAFFSEKKHDELPALNSSAFRPHLLVASQRERRDQTIIAHSSSVLTNQGQIHAQPCISVEVQKITVCQCNGSTVLLP